MENEPLRPYSCPKCGSGDDISISAYAPSVTVSWVNGVEFLKGQNELSWDSDDIAWCGECGWEGMVIDLVDNSQEGSDESRI